MFMCNRLPKCIPITWATKWRLTLYDKRSGINKKKSKCLSTSGLLLCFLFLKFIRQRKHNKGTILAGLYHMTPLV